MMKNAAMPAVPMCCCAYHTIANLCVLICCSLNLRWLPSQLKRLSKLHKLEISATKLNVATLFKGMASMRGLRSAVIADVGRDKKTKEQGLPDDLLTPLAQHTGEAAHRHHVTHSSHSISATDTAHR
jgi:hypothetical protein